MFSENDESRIMNNILSNFFEYNNWIQIVVLSILNIYEQNSH